MHTLFQFFGVDIIENENDLKIFEPKISLNLHNLCICTYIVYFPAPNISSFCKCVFLFFTTSPKCLRSVLHCDKTLWNNTGHFVLGHNLFLEAHRSPRAAPLENYLLLGTVNVCRHISKHISSPNRGYCLFILAFWLGLTDDLCGDRYIDDVINILFVSLSYKTSRFHVVAKCLFSNSSQKVSKCAKNISDTWLSPCVPLCSYHILMLFVICYWADAQQHWILFASCNWCSP